jgi:hypothetical protein
MTVSTTLVGLFVQAGRVVGPGQPIVPLVLMRLRRGRPEDAEARREWARVLGGDDLELSDRP